MNNKLAGYILDGEFYKDIMEIAGRTFSEGHKPLPVYFKEEKIEIKEFTDAMTLLGEAHDLLSKTKLDMETYNPISNKLAKAKISLFNIYNKIKTIV